MLEQSLRERGDPQLLEDWGKAAARDRADPKGMHRVIFWDRFRTGEYAIERRRAAFRQKASERRARALISAPAKDDEELGSRRIGDALG